PARTPGQGDPDRQRRPGPGSTVLRHRRRGCCGVLRRPASAQAAIPAERPGAGDRRPAAGGARGNPHPLVPARRAAPAGSGEGAGGAGLGREFLAAGLVDELALAVAPFFIGAAAAPRFAGPAVYPHGPGRPMHLVEVRQLDEVVLLRYLLGDDGSAARGEAWARPDRGDRAMEAEGGPGPQGRGDRDPGANGIRGGP